MRRPEARLPVSGGDGLFLRQWIDFFFDIYKAMGVIRETKIVSATINFANTAAHSTSTSTVTVAGARANDFVTIGYPATVDDGMVYTGHVSADDTVTVRAVNTTGGAINPASATYKVKVTM